MTQYYDGYAIASPYLPQSLRDSAVALQGSASVPSESYHDVVVGYTTSRSGSTFSGMKISAGVNNVFNTYPTIIAVSSLNVIEWRLQLRGGSAPSPVLPLGVEIVQPDRARALLSIASSASTGCGFAARRAGW